MGNAIHDKKAQIEYLTNRLNLLLSVLDTISPEEADVEDIDRLLQMLEDLQSKINQFKTDW
ncbi:SE1561 family protein [Schinkia sp. CFF1]